jgi:signal transduction histidine kinase
VDGALTDNPDSRTRPETHPVRALLADRRFWAIQVALLILALVHNSLETSPSLPAFKQLYFIPETLELVLVILSALLLGLRGAIVSGIWAVVSTIPNFIFYHSGEDRYWEIALVVGVVAVAIVLAIAVEERSEALRRARVFARQSVMAQEEERKYLSRELHDTPLQTLALVCREIDSLRDFGSSQQEMRDGLGGIRKNVETCDRQLRELIGDIRPITLSDLGLAPSLRSLVNRYSEDAPIQVQITVQGNERQLLPEQEIGLYRIAQEALRNALGHAQASCIVVTLKFEPSLLTLVIQDDGLGFVMPSSPTYLAGESRYGIVGMYEYAEIIGGKLTITSKLRKGTQIRAVVPVR